MGRGRPKTDESLLIQALELIADGMSIRKACAKAGISTKSFMTKVSTPEYLQLYARAMENRADAIFDEICDIADSDSQDVQRDRLRVDARKWVVSKMLPKKYGDKMTQEITGKDGAPIGFRFVTPDASTS